MTQHDLILANRGLVFYMARQIHRPGGMPYEDLVSLGDIGLCVAAQRFDETRGFKFSTYASNWIRAYMFRGLQDHSSLPKDRDSRALFWRLGRAQLRLEQGNQPATVENIARECGISEEKAAALLQHLLRGEIHLQAFEDDWLTYDAPSPEEVYADKEENEWRSETVRRIVNRLPPRERYIIRERHLSANGKSLTEIGNALGITRERTRQLEQRALKAIRAFLDGEPMIANSRHWRKQAA